MFDKYLNLKEKVGKNFRVYVLLIGFLSDLLDTRKILSRRRSKMRVILSECFSS